MAFVLVQRKCLQGFHKPGQYRQRRANFVRHVGDKIPAHGIGLFQCRDVARQQKHFSVAVRMQLDGELDWAVRRVGSPRHGHVAPKITRAEIGRKARVTHQITKMLQHVTLGLKAKMGRSRLVEPLNVSLRVKQCHAIGTGLERRQKILQTFITGLRLALTRLELTTCTVSNFTPQAA